MKNLLPVLDDIIEDKPKRLSKEERKIIDERYWNNWSKYLGKTSKVNIENLLGLTQKEIVSRYLHTLPEEYRNLDWLYHRLGISKVNKENNFIDPRWGYYETAYFGDIYYFNENDILSVKRREHKKWRKFGTRSERMKKYHENLQAKKRNFKLRKLQKEQEYQDMLHNIELKRKEKEEKINLQKIISHGFDPKTSFRPEYKEKNK